MRIVILLVVSFLSVVSAKRVNLDSEMEKLANKVTSNIKSTPDSLKSLVILPLNDARAPGFGAMVEQYLTIPLVQGGKVSVVDRSQIATIMQEVQLQEMIDQPAKIGKLVAANYMLTGTVSTGFDSTYLVTLRVISVETSQVVGAASLEIPSAELDKRVRRN